MFKHCEVSEVFTITGRSIKFKYLSVGEQEWVSNRMNAIGMSPMAHGVTAVRRIHELAVAIKDMDFEPFGIDTEASGEEFEEDLREKFLWFRKLDSAVFDYIFDAYQTFCTDHAIQLINEYRTEEEKTWPGIKPEEFVVEPGEDG